MNTIELSPVARTQPSQRTSVSDVEPSKPLIIYNDDTCSLRYVDEPHTEEALTIPLRYLAGTQVGAISWLMGEDTAYSWPSKVMENYYDLLDAGHRIVLGDDDGPNASERSFDRLAPREDPRNVMVTLHRKGIDYLPMLIGCARKLGMKFYGSFRMNDCHHKSAPRGILSSRFWQEHQDYRLWEVTAARTYYNAALDYSYPEVRQRRLDPIRETLEWYDLDGIELDFCRNPYTFPPSQAWDKREILTEFIRQIRANLDEAGQRRGRQLDLLLRVPFDDRKRREAGMDVDAWIDGGLIDILVMSCKTNDYNQRLEPWLTRCRERNVGFYPSTEVGPAHNSIYNHVTPESIDEIAKRQRAMAQNFIGQGASGVYMFNYPCYLFQARRSSDEFAQLASVCSELGRQETLAGRAKQYTFWRNLPLQIESRRPAQYHQTIRFAVFDSDVKKGDAGVQLSFRQATEPNPHVDARHHQDLDTILPPGWVTYWLNGTEVPESWIQREPQPAGNIVSGFKLGMHERITITPPASTLRSGENTLGFYVPRFPEEHDPYIMIYELLLDISPASTRSTA